MKQSDYINDLAAWLLRLLKDGRQKDKITPEKPMRGIDICVKFQNERCAVERITTADLRQAVHYLRAVESQPVGSINGEGYYWCISAGEWQEVKKSLMNRAKNQMAAASNPDEYFNDSKQLSLNFMEG